MKKCGLEINPAKCASLALDVVRRISFTDGQSFLRVNNEGIPALKIDEAYKYLGLHVSAKGAEPRVLSKLTSSLENLRKAPLKPQQRLFALKQNVIPATLHQLVLGKPSRGLLKGLDKIIRKSCRNWLKLPHDSLNSFLHGEIKDGGLGIRSLCYAVPQLKIRRIGRLKASSDPAVREAANSEWFNRELDHWCKPLLIGKEPANSPDQEKFAWTVDLYGKTDGAGLQTAREVPYVHSWVGSGNALMSGHKYCAAIALRAGALPCAERMARGRPNRRKTCEQCPNKTEYLYHILQVCPRTHGPRVKRHDYLVKKLNLYLEKAGWNILVEPRIPTADSFVKPDLIIWNEETAVVLDVAVCGDDQDAGRIAYRNKITKYSVDHPEVSPWVKALTTKEPTYSALIINWRGCIHSKSEIDLRAMGLSKAAMKLLSLSTVEWGTVAHRIFMCSTSRARGRLT